MSEPESATDFMSSTALRASFRPVIIPRQRSGDLHSPRRLQPSSRRSASLLNLCPRLGFFFFAADLQLQQRPDFCVNVLVGPLLGEGNLPHAVPPIFPRHNLLLSQPAGQLLFRGRGNGRVKRHKAR